jgi:hypothetical protein
MLRSVDRSNLSLVKKTRKAAGRRRREVFCAFCELLQDYEAKKAQRSVVWASTSVIGVATGTYSALDIGVTVRNEVALTHDLVPFLPGPVKLNLVVSPLSTLYVKMEARLPC